MPSGDVAAILLLYATATNRPFPKVTAFQFAALGKVRAVHVMPSGDVAAALVASSATATKTPFPKATERQV